MAQRVKSVKRKSRFFRTNKENGAGVGVIVVWVIVAAVAAQVVEAAHLKRRTSGNDVEVSSFKMNKASI